MSRAGRVRASLGGLIAVLAATAPCLARTVPQDAPGGPVRWTTDERLYHGDARLAPRFACNTHLSASAPKDRSGGDCAVLKFACDMRIKAACARLAPYRPDFHNIERATRETSLFDMSTYTALHGAAATSPLSHNEASRAGTADPNTPLERKVPARAIVR